MDPTKVDKRESKRTKPNFNQEVQEMKEAGLRKETAEEN